MKEKNKTGSEEAKDSNKKEENVGLKNEWLQKLSNYLLIYL